MKTKLLSTVAMFVVAAAVWPGTPVSADQDDRDDHPSHEVHTATPIKHLVIIFNENRSFDHYFATYPNATQPARRAALQGEPATRRR